MESLCKNLEWDPESRRGYERNRAVIWSSSEYIVGCMKNESNQFNEQVQTVRIKIVCIA